MADTKISALSDGTPMVGSTDYLAIARSGSNYKLPASQFAAGIGGLELIYRYTVAGTDKASIDTGADTADAGSTVWSGGDVLEIFVSVRTDDAAALSNIDLTVNNDTGNNYDRELVQGNASSAAAGPDNGVARWRIFAHGAGGTSGHAGVITFTFPNYAGTTFNKTGFLSNSVPDATSSNAVIALFAAGWRSTAAITRFKIAAVSTAKLKVGTQLSIYKRRSS